MQVSGAMGHAAKSAIDRLSDLTDFGPNPGALDARIYAPENLPRGAPLVVVLHGCTQTAASYDHGAGWSRLADEQGFALLFPEQRRTNNAQTCFNWFLPDDTRRDRGEAASIAGMIRAMEVRHQLDPKRVFVTGLSAGGAMTAVMLATYPEMFAGGAIIAGLPYGVADDVQRALGAMRVPTGESGDGLAVRVRAASQHTGPWPRLSVWHGSADRTVAPGNADAIVRQWATLQGVGGARGEIETLAGHTRTRWRGADGRVAIEQWRLVGMGHGTPLGDDGLGTPGAYMLAAGVSSTRRIADFWGLNDVDVERVLDAVPSAPAPRVAQRMRRLTPEPLDPRGAGAARPSGVGAVIDAALRKAGLLR